MTTHHMTCLHVTGRVDWQTNFFQLAQWTTYR